MPRSMHAARVVAVAALAFCACAKSSESQPIVSAPIGAPASLDGSAGSTALAPSAPSASVLPGASASTTPSASGSGLTMSGPADPNVPGSPTQYQACQQDSDCVAVPRVGCCNNGHREAVNASQTDAYKQSFTCPRPHPCPMYMIRDNRLPKCDPGTKLCTMVSPATP
jgi:hypothetical protein